MPWTGLVALTLVLALYWGKFPAVQLYPRLVKPLLRLSLAIGVGLLIGIFIESANLTARFGGLFAPLLRFGHLQEPSAAAFTTPFFSAYYGDHYPGPGRGTVEPDYGELIATTDKNGKYSKFVPIPGDYERVTVWAELDGYTFEPVIHSWFHKAGLETKTLDFTAAPGVPGPFPGPGAALDFAYQAGAATWTSGAGTLMYPGTEGDTRGFVRQLQETTFEDGLWMAGPTCWSLPRIFTTASSKGTYPPYTVQKGDRFRTSVGCAYGYGCYAIFRLRYRIGNGPIYTFWSWTEKNEGRAMSRRCAKGAAATSRMTSCTR